MIESILLGWLRSLLDVPVRTEKQKGLDTYVLIEKTGSSEANGIESATVAIQSYADSLYHAAELNKKVKEAMRASVSLPNVSRAALNSDYNYTDTTTKEHRYQAVFDVVFFDD